MFRLDGFCDITGFSCVNLDLLLYFTNEANECWSESELSGEFNRSKLFGDLFEILGDLSLHFDFLGVF